MDTDARVLFLVSRKTLAVIRLSLSPSSVSSSVAEANQSLFLFLLFSLANKETLKNYATVRTGG